MRSTRVLEAPNDGYKVATSDQPPADAKQLVTTTTGKKLAR